MLGKASELKVKQFYGRLEMNPEYERGNGKTKYLEIPLDRDVNEFLASIGESEVVSVQYQMSVHENISDSILLIYKEG